MASQAGSYAALLAGGVAVTAAATGHSIRDILAGRRSPIRPLVSDQPAVALGGGPSSGTSNPLSALLTPGTGGGAGNAGQMIRWAKAVVGTQEGSAAQQKWAQSAGVSSTAPWCSVFIAYGLKRMGVAPPSNPAYSGTWLEGWSGGQNLHTTSLRSAKPGDLLIFDWGDGGITDHVALYLGGGKMIGGNQGNEVSMESVPSGNIVGIVRPNYPSKASSSRRPTRRGGGARTVSA